MTALLEEMSSLIRALADDEARSLLDIARYLAGQPWERSLAATSTAFRDEVADVRRVVAAGRASPLRVEDL